MEMQGAVEILGQSVRTSLAENATRHAVLGGFTGTMGFEPTTVGLEVRRSFRTELRALESTSTTE